MIADVTSDFVYARLQRTSDKVKTGYTPAALDTWASRAQAWADGGAQKGRDADMPPAPQFGAGWKFGEPDYIVKMPAAYELPAEGQIDYLSFYIPVPFDHDVFVEKIEMKPSNKAVVHHETGWAASLTAWTASRSRRTKCGQKGPAYSRARACRS